jgi:hypothetical protein
MGKTLKISKEQINNMYRATRRAEDIEKCNLHFKGGIHKSIKEYNRKEGKRVSFD